MVFVDEALFTRNTVNINAFCNKNAQVQLSSFGLDKPTVHAIAAISEENGIEALITDIEHTNTDLFLQIIDEIKVNGDHFTLFFDNVSYHVSKDAKKVYEDENIGYIASIVGVPELNPIESFFLRVKN